MADEGAVKLTSLLCQLGIILLTSLFVGAKILRVNDEFDADFKLVEGNKRIRRNCIGNFTKVSLQMCVYKCISNKSCKTFNYHEVLQICEILNISKFDELRLLEFHRGWNHYETDCNKMNMGDVCESGGMCKEYEACEDTYDNRLYTCKCPDGFNGPKCENYIGRGSTESNPVPACTLILSKYNLLQDGYYWVMKTNAPKAVKTFCRRKDTGTWEALTWTRWSYCELAARQNQSRIRECHDPRAKDTKNRNCVDEVENRTCVHVPMSSCKEIIETHPSARNGLYTLSSKTRSPVKVYCDMATGSGGWILIGNVTIKKEISEKEAKTIQAAHSTEITELYKVQNGHFLLDALALKDLNIKLAEIRFYCQKNGKIIHIYSVKRSVIDFFLKESATMDDRPNACDTFKTYSDDNSYMSQHCEEWRYAKWGWPTSGRVNSVYTFPIYIYGKKHYTLYLNRFECDDASSSNKGVWRVYVR